MTTSVENVAGMARAEIRELIARCAGYAVADATCALARALEVYRAGDLDSTTKDLAADQLVRLQRLHARARSQGLSFEQFRKAAQIDGANVLRGRLGSDASDVALAEWCRGRWNYFVARSRRKTVSS